MVNVDPNVVTGLEIRGVLCLVQLVGCPPSGREPTRLGALDADASLNTGDFCPLNVGAGPVLLREDVGRLHVVDWHVVLADAAGEAGIGVCLVWTKTGPSDPLESLRKAETDPNSGKRQVGPVAARLDVNLDIESVRGGSVAIDGVKPAVVDGGTCKGVDLPVSQTTSLGIPNFFLSASSDWLALPPTLGHLAS
jgi:hypothetical protein